MNNYQGLLGINSVTKRHDITFARRSKSLIKIQIDLTKRNLATIAIRYIENLF